MSFTPQLRDEAPGSLAGPKPSPGDLWQRYHSSGPGDASEEELVKKYLPLVKTVVGRLAMSLPPHVDPEDLHSAGLMGLLNALRQYKPQTGVPFESYARVRIRGAVLDELRRMDWVPRLVHEKARRVQAVMASLEQRQGRLPEDEEMAEALELPLEDYHKLMEEIRPVTFICLEAVESPNYDAPFTEKVVLPDANAPDPLETASRQELARLIAERIETLPAMHQKVIALYYFEDFRVREIAEACGVSSPRICHIHTQAILAIRAYVEKYEGASASMTRRAAA